MNRIINARFIKSVAHISQIPPDSFPQVAFAGRSNVGKSSGINRLLNRKKLAQTSSTPGKTRLLNFFLVNEKYYFVDLPGYGFARVPPAMRQQWKTLVQSYLSTVQALKALVVFIDLRHEMTPLDLELVDWLSAHEVQVIIAGTKADKLSGNQLSRHIAMNEKKLLPFGINQLIPFSAKTGIGKNELLKEIFLRLD